MPKLNIPKPFELNDTQVAEYKADKSPVGRLDKLIRGASPQTIRAMMGIELEEMPDFEKQIADAKSTYETARTELGDKQAKASAFGLLLQLAVGMYGIKHGVDVSGARFDKMDWSNKFDDLREDFKNTVSLKQIEMQKEQRRWARYQDIASGTISGLENKKAEEWKVAQLKQAEDERAAAKEESYNWRRFDIAYREFDRNRVEAGQDRREKKSLYLQQYGDVNKELQGLNTLRKEVTKLAGKNLTREELAERLPVEYVDSVTYPGWFRRQWERLPFTEDTPSSVAQLQLALKTKYDMLKQERDAVQSKFNSLEMEVGAKGSFDTQIKPGQIVLGKKFIGTIEQGRGGNWRDASLWEDAEAPTQSVVPKEKPIVVEPKRTSIRGSGEGLFTDEGK
jgi:hypothetical protein